MSPSRAPPSPHHSYYHQTSTMERHPRSSANRRSASSGSDLLQTKLRRLLNTEKEMITSSDDILIPPPPKTYDDYYQPHRSPKNYQQQLTVHPEPQNDVNVFFPSAFLSPQSLPPHPSDDLDVLYSYSIDDDDEFLERPISPPEQYATNTPPKKEKIKKEKQRYDYQRSHSHSQTMTADEYRQRPSVRSNKDPYSNTTSNNINSHKSLPDLHTQISRHSPHSEALSSCSRGNRSNRSGSSGFNRDRDSGGSSGHFTHRSEPCCKQMEKIMLTQQQQQSPTQQQEYRRDSGSSTQHSGNSYYAYQQQFRYDCIECRAKMRENETLFNFPVEVPEAFQDGYQESSDTLRNTYYNQQTTTSVIRSPSPGSSQDVMSPSSQKMELSPLSPPLGTFKRQKCLRFKNFRYSNTSNAAQTSTSQPNSLQIQTEDDRRPILRSKSDISDRYWNRIEQQPNMSVKSRRDRYQQAANESFGSNGSGSSNGKLSKSDSMYELEHFFDHLGLDDKNYAETIVRSRKKHQRSASAVVTTNYSDNDDDVDPTFFSDCSTIDSNRIIADSGPTNSDPKSVQVNPNLYRPPSEPLSIIERNARIIKWLCNCKKSLL
jgi:Centrosome-associated C terminus